MIFQIPNRMTKIDDCKIISIILFFAFCLISNVYAQTTWEFDGTPYAYQKVHFDSATNVIRNKLGIQMHTFGAPYNQIDTTFIRVMSEDTSYKVLLFGQDSPSPASGQINLTNRVFIESATGVPDYNYFLTSYNSKKSTYTDYMVMQGHAYAWTTSAKQTEFQNIVAFLISEGVQFMTPYDYYRYITDLTIPRTNKVKVILKLDDLRATTNYFIPCFAAYDYLASHKIKAGFGVNNMTNLTQAQIDTLNYYLRQTDSNGDLLFEIWNHGLDHSQTVVTSGGNWSDPSIWPSGSVPTSAEDVIIEAGTTVTIDANNATCQNLTINGTLVTLNTSPTSLTVNGDLLINSGGSFTSPALTGATSNIMHNLTLYGDFTNAGGTFDFRMGSAGTTMRVLNITFAGNLSSVINVGTYSSSNNDFNSITINKTGGAKVICASDVFLDPGSSACVSQLILTNGLVETGNYSINVLSTASTDLVTPSSTSYVNGALGRGMSNSAGKLNSFAIGDSRGYRPISVRSTTGGVASGHYCQVRCISGNANTGSTTYVNGIDKVSNVRYYSVSYNKGIGAAATSMSFNQFSPSYGTDDGVIAGKTDLRVAYSVDNRLTWTGINQTTTHTTSLVSPPTTITPDLLATALTLASGSGYIYASIAEKSGGLQPLPVELSSFISNTNGRDIALNWETRTEKNSDKFIIERACMKTSLNELNWEPISSIKASVLSNSPKQYSYIDKKLQAGKYQYRLKMIDNDGSYAYSKSIEDEIVPPSSFELSQNYPNPFNPSTKINYSLPADSKVSLEVYNIAGEKISRLVNEDQSAGYYSVDFGLFSGRMTSGIYIYRITVNEKASEKNFSSAKKMMLLK